MRFFEVLGGSVNFPTFVGGNFFCRGFGGGRQGQNSSFLSCKLDEMVTVCLLMKNNSINSHGFYFRFMGKSRLRA
jgi:hypothetical protein